MRLHSILALVIALCCGWVIASAADPAPGDVLEQDLWFVGDINGQPSVSLHALTTKHADGSRTAMYDMAIVLKRSLGPGQVDAIEMRQSQQVDEDGDGAITTFRFDDDENGSRTTASGRVAPALPADGADAGSALVATIHRLGRKTDVRIPVPKEVKLLGEVAWQRMLAKQGLEAGQSLSFTSVALISGRLTLVKQTATLAERTAEGDLVFTVLADVIPIPMRVTVGPTGVLRGMAMDMGFLKIDVRPASGPVALLGAELAPDSLVKHAGPVPQPVAVNRYRLPEGATVLEDEFQRTAGGVVEVLAQAAPALLDEIKPFLQAEPPFELDDKDLRAWVAGQSAGKTASAEIAETLRLAVRSHIRIKDLSKGDGSALETYRSKRGDCTEHANLLCAALRIAGIPARVEVGVVYAADYGGWVGHAWNSAHVDGRWTHLDSAYPGLPRSLYLAVGRASGLDVAKTLGVQFANLVSLAGKTIEALPAR